jgi:hypothetical protein
MIQAIPSMAPSSSMPPTLMASADPSAGLPELPIIPPEQTSVETTSEDPMKQAVKTLGAHLRELFGKAKNARQSNGVDDEMMRSKRARAQEYEPEKLSAIRALMGGQQYDPPYLPITETKCRDLVSWLLAVPSDENLWSLEAAPLPELPEDIKVFASQKFKQEIASEMAKQHPELLQAGPEGLKQLQEMIDSELVESMPKRLDFLMLQLKRKAKEMADRLSIKVEGALDDGNWREEIEKSYYDIATYPASFIKGPIPKKIKAAESEYDPMTGLQRLKIVEKVIDTYKRVSPTNIYPAPDAITIEDGDLFEVESIAPGELYQCIGVEGYNTDAIRRVLQKFRETGFHEWVQFDSERSTIDKRGIQYNQGAGSKIDIVCAWASVQGKLLINAGMPRTIIDDEEREYQAWCYFIEDEVIMARLNPDPLGKKRYYKASFIEDPDKFWNTSLPALIRDYQNIGNAIARACGHNIAYASGPITEVNRDRLAPGESTVMHPYATKISTKTQMQENAPLMRFYQARLIVGELKDFYNFIMAQCDTDSGVPHFIAGGSSKEPGAGKTTLGGMQMKRNDAARGLEQVRGNISKGQIAPSVEAQYHQILHYDGAKTVGGIKVKTRGTEWLAVRDQQSQRLDDALAKSNNQVDLQIFGMKGRQELWREKLKAMHIDSDKLLPEDRDLIMNLTGGQVAGPVGEPNRPGLPGPAQGAPGAAPSTEFPSFGAPNDNHRPQEIMQ